MERKYKQLSIEERTMIQTQLEMGIKPAAVAKELDHSASTLSRELNRNGWTRPKVRRKRGRPAVTGGYRSEAANRRAHACTAKLHVERRLRLDTPLWERVCHYLKARYSPEQIAGTLALVHPDTPSLQVSHKTIYTAIYAMLITRFLSIYHVKPWNRLRTLHLHKLFADDPKPWNRATPHRRLLDNVGSLTPKSSASKNNNEQELSWTLVRM